MPLVLVAAAPEQWVYRKGTGLALLKSYLFLYRDSGSSGGGGGGGGDASGAGSGSAGAVGSAGKEQG